MAKITRNLIRGSGNQTDHEARKDDCNDNCDRDNDYGSTGAWDMDFVPALLGEIKSLAVTPFGTYGICDNRLLRGVILFGTASSSRDWKNRKSFVLDDMTGSIDIEFDKEETPAISSTIMVIGTLERRNGMNNVKAKYVKHVPPNEIKPAVVWHTLKVIESINLDTKSASRASELLKIHSFLNLVRRSSLNSNQILLRHLLFAIGAQTDLLLKEKEQQKPEGI